LTVYRWPLLMRLAEMRRNQLVNSQTESSTDESTKAEP
jgi:hypothetical protein